MRRITGPIVRRSTSSLAAQRYATADDLARAIRLRHVRAILLALAVAVAAGVLFLSLFQSGSVPIVPPARPKFTVREVKSAVPRQGKESDVTSDSMELLRRENELTRDPGFEL